MKCLLSFFVFMVVFCTITKGQQNKPELLPEPSGWEFERFPLPPSFAPAIWYKGVEELRFSPGMFKKEAPDYFTYVFVAQIDGTIAITQTDVRNYLTSYYRGLCSVTAKDRKLSIDTSKITAVVEKKKGSPAIENQYDALVNLFGVFDDGAPVRLNLEINVLRSGSVHKTWLFFIASPRAKSDHTWKELYAIREKAMAAFK